MNFGKPVKFFAYTPIEQERWRICDYLINEITEIACCLPEHIVVPYSNISKQLYTKNIKNELEIKEKN